MVYRLLKLGHPRRVAHYFKNLAPGVFLQELCARPGAIGAICPSSPYLARRMAQQVPEGDGIVVELGGGTGVITRALLDHGVPPQRLIVIELSSSFVQRLRDRFPDVRIVHGSAADLAQLIPQGEPIRAIVSSLPLCSLPAPISHAILDQWRILLNDDGVAVQFTYNLRRPGWRDSLRAQEIRSTVVWANLPPANISTFSFKTRKLTPPRHEHHTP